MPNFLPKRAPGAWLKNIKISTVGSLFWAVVVQVCLLILTIFVVVMVPKVKKEPEFIAHKTIYLPQKALDHQMACAEFEQIASPPVVMDRLQAQSLASHSLPNLPSLPDVPVSTLDAVELSMSSELFFEQSNLASLAGSYSGGASSVSFFGVQDTGQRIVIAFDVSKSVIDKMQHAGVSIESIKEETKSLLGHLNPNTTFGVIQFIRRFDVFQKTLVAGTSRNQELAIQWVDETFHTSGYSPRNWERISGSNGKPLMDGIQAVITTAFLWEPDVIFIISDGGFGRNFPKKVSRIELNELDRDISRFQSELPERTRIHFIGFEVKPERETELKKIVRKWGGTYRSF